MHPGDIMRSNFCAGTALATILAGLVSTCPALAEGGSKDSRPTTVNEQPPNVTQEMLLRELERSRLQTLILAQAIGEFCDETDAELTSCALFAQLETSGALAPSDMMRTQFAGPLAAPRDTATTTKSPATRAAAAPGPLAAANASDACADGSGSNSLQCGDGADASGSDSTAIGDNAVADSAEATAVGASAEATGTEATAIGSDAQAGASATAVGGRATASASESVAVGKNSEASAMAAIAIGADAEATAPPRTPTCAARVSHRRDFTRSPVGRDRGGRDLDRALIRRYGKRGCGPGRVRRRGRG